MIVRAPSSTSVTASATSPRPMLLPTRVVPARATAAASSVVVCVRRRTGSSRMPIEGYITLGIVVAVRGLHVRATRAGQHPVQHHPGRWRHGCARVGPGLPARPPVAARPADRLDARLVRRLPRVPVLHGAPVAADRVAELRDPVRHRLQARRHQRRAHPADRGLRVRSVDPLALPDPAAARRRRRPLFLFDRSFSIYGGNIASTLAGEFAFSISLSFAVLYLGVVGRGLESGKYRAWAAVLLALHRAVPPDPALLRASPARSSGSCST